MLIKRRKNQDMLIGVAGRAKALQVLFRLNGIIPLDKTKNPYIFISQTITPIIQLLMNDEKLTSTSEESPTEEEFQDSEILIAYRGRLFLITGDFTALEINENFYSIGSGEDYAMASIKTALDAGQTDPQQIISQALKTAEQYCCSVRGPFRTIEVLIEKPVKPSATKESAKKEKETKGKKKE